jgi:DNA-binding response OmpR family regulator
VQSATSKPPVILCLDGEELQLKIHYEVLSRQGYQVLSAHSGESALRMFTDNHVDLVISDNRLPDLAGTEIIAEMKHLRPAIPIMMLSEIPQVPPGDQIADSFITKGISTKAFLAAVANLLNGTVATSTTT